MAEAVIENEDELRAWLEDKPREWAQVIALRCALRVLPVIAHADWTSEGAAKNISLAMLRVQAIAFCFIHFQNNQLVYKVVSNAAFTTYNAVYSSSNAGYTALNAASASASAYAAFAYTAKAAAKAAAKAVKAASDTEYHANVRKSDIWQMINIDINDLQNGQVPEALNFTPVWHSQPQWFVALIAKLKASFVALGDDFSLWSEWYQRRVDGKANAFAGFDGDANEQFYSFLVEQDDDWWKREPALVNADIKALVDSLRKVKTPTDQELLQNPKALTFKGNEQQQISIADATDPESLQADQEAQDRHKMARESALNALACSNRDMTQASDIAEPIQRYLEALGETVESIRASQIIVYGARLRKVINERATSNAAPFSEKQVETLDEWRMAHNAMVGLDPFLASIERATADPEEPAIIIDLDAIKAAIEDGRTQEVLTEEAATALDDARVVIPDDAKVEDSRRIRLTDSLRNAIRSAATIIKENRGEIALVGSGFLNLAYKSAGWVQRHGEWLLKLFADEPSMLGIIEWILTIPL